MRNFRQVLAGISVQPLLNQIDAHPELWNSDDSWSRGKPSDTAIHAVSNIVLRYTSITPPGQTPRYNKRAFAVLSEAERIIFDLMRAIPGEHLGKVLISRMAPGEVIYPHVDMLPPGMPPYYQRYQIPLSVHPGVWFACGDEQLYMEPGCAYWFDNQLVHSVINRSAHDRVSMLTDIRPWEMGQL